MIGLRPQPLAAGLLAWIAVHALLPVLALEDTDRPVATLVLTGLLVLSSVTALAPLLRGRVPVRPAAAAAHALLLPVSAVLVGTSVDRAALLTYLTWWPGAVGPVLAGLALRRRPGHAAAAAASSAVVLWVVLAQRLGVSDWPAHAVVCSLPLLFWSGGASAIGLLLDRSAVLVRRSERARAAATATRREVVGRAGARREREALLRREAVPVLSDLADERVPLGEGLRARAGAAEAALRRELRGRSLLDDAVRAAVGRALARGVRVDLVDDADRGAGPGPDAAVRALAARGLDAALDGHLTVRRPPGDEVLTTLVHDGSPASIARVAQALGGADSSAPAAPPLPPGLELATVVDGVLIAELRREPSREDADGGDWEDPPGARR